MVKNSVLIVFLIFIFLSCTKKDSEQIADIPDEDWGSVQKTDKDTAAVTEEEEQPDMQDADVKADKNPANDVDNQPVCGNTIIEDKEYCDTQPLDCAKINPGMTGIATCKKNCTGYDMVKCTKKSSAYGVMSINFSTSYILDGAKVNDQTYLAKGAQMIDGFVGTFGANLPIPPVEATLTDSYASTTPGAKGNRITYVKQFSFAGGTLLYPSIELEFPEGAITKDTYNVNAIDTIIFNKRWLGCGLSAVMAERRAFRR